MILFKESTQYFESGKMKQHYFKDGLKHGEEIQYSENGDITLKIIYFEENSK